VTAVMRRLHLSPNLRTDRASVAVRAPQIRDPRSFSLLRQFLEQMVAAELELRAGDDPSAVIPDIDWNEIWAAADGCTSEEEAIGNVVLAAYLAAGSSQVTGARVESYRVLDNYPLLARYAVSPWRPVEPADLQQNPPAEVARPVVKGSTLTVPLALVEDLWRGIRSNEQHPSTERRPSKAHRRFLRRRALATLFGWMRNIGIVILLFVAWQLWGTSISQHHDQQQLQSTFDASLHAHHTGSSSSNNGPALISAKKQVPVPTEGTPVAQLAIPAIDLSEYVVSGTAEGDLAKGPGHYIGTAAPGQAGNVAIAGHRTTNGAPFNRLGQLTIGDQIYLTTSSGERLTYMVSQAPVAVSPSDVTVLDYFGDNRITLTTCNPEYSSSQRLIVVGELKQPKPPVATGAKPRAYHVVDSKTASWNWSSLPVVVIEAGVLILLGLSYRRFAVWFRGLSRWIILTPIWIAALYLLFQSLATFLPAAV
jgi:LPXTG-site transpeptidase (sortase) family protein